MATTEAGGIVPMELREQLIEHMRFSTLINEPDELTADAVDEMLAAIADAGYELVPVDRMERLVNLALAVEAYAMSNDLGDEIHDHLDRPGGAE
jgi:hypothetical protein